MPVARRGGHLSHSSRPTAVSPVTGGDSRSGGDAGDWMPDIRLDADEGRPAQGDLVALMHGVLRSLASTTTPHDVLRVIVSRGAHDFEPVAAAIGCQVDHAIVDVAHWGARWRWPTTGPAKPSRTARDPWTDALNLCEPIWVASQEERIARYPDLEIGNDIASLAALPLVANGAVFGVLAIGFGSPDHFDAPRRAFLVLLADLCTLLLRSDASTSAAYATVELVRFPTNGAAAAAPPSPNGSDDGIAPALGLHPRLTAREQQIAIALTEGRRSSAVARDLGISIYTVRKHISAILRKYDATSQTELVARIYRQSADARSEPA